jgi:hypothetical protein
MAAKRFTDHDKPSYLILDPVFCKELVWISQLQTWEQCRNKVKEHGLCYLHIHKK